MPWRAGIPPTVPDARARWLYRALNAIWIWVGLVCVLSAVQFYADPASIARSSIGHALDGPADDLWNIAWGIGGVLITYGVWTMRPAVEIIGHLFLTVAVLTNAIAVLVLLGPGPSAVISLGVGLASMTRVAYLWLTTPHRPSA